MSGSGTQFSRNVFVLDVSTSMTTPCPNGGSRCDALQLGVTRIIEELPDYSYVGVVLFGKTVETPLNMTQITDRSVRNVAIRSIPASGHIPGTNIGDGIMSGVSLLKDSGLDTTGASLFLVTDGENWHGVSDYPSNVLPTLLKDKVI